MRFSKIYGVGKSTISKRLRSACQGVVGLARRDACGCHVAGQVTPNAIEGRPGVNIHAFRCEAVWHKLEIIGEGSFVVLGVVPGSARLEERYAQKGNL